LGHLPATQTGILGRWTGGGSNSPAQSSASPAQPVIQQPRSLARFDDLPERHELLGYIRTQADSESETTGAEVIERHRFPRELLHPPARERGHERAEAQPFGPGGDRAQRHPRVGDRPDRGSPDDVVPHEQPVPSTRLCLHRELDEDPWVGEFVKGR
jgi:hypothetical protein